jgi:hypothetical protein
VHQLAVVATQDCYQATLSKSIEGMHHPLKEYNQVEKGQTVTGGTSNREIYQCPIALFIQNTFNYLLNTIVCCLKTPKDIIGY